MAGIQITKEAKLGKGSKQEGRHSKGLSRFQLFYGFISPISHSLQKYLTELVCSPRHKKCLRIVGGVLECIHCLIKNNGGC